MRKSGENGLKNLFQRYIAIVDKWVLIDNSKKSFNFIAEGANDERIIKDQELWVELIKKYYGS